MDQLERRITEKIREGEAIAIYPFTDEQGADTAEGVRIALAFRDQLARVPYKQFKLAERITLGTVIDETEVPTESRQAPTVKLEDAEYVTHGRYSQDDDGRYTITVTLLTHPKAEFIASATYSQEPGCTRACVGAVIGGLGIVSMGVAVGSSVGASSECPSGNCASQSDLDSYNTWKTVATVSFWTSASLLVVAGVLLGPTILGGSSERAMIRIVPGGIGAQVRF